MHTIRYSPLGLLVVLLLLGAASANGQAPKQDDRGGDDKAKVATNERPEDPSTTAANAKKEDPLILIHLVGGGRLQVEDVRETADGVWYKRGNVETLIDPKQVVRIERPSNTVETKKPLERLTRSTSWKMSNAAKIENFFLTKFGRSLPTTAFGQSDIHNRWGLDHRKGIDVGLHPDSREGVALQEFLRAEGIPFMAFRGAIPGVATGPHIHIGNPSPRYLPR